MFLTSCKCSTKCSFLLKILGNVNVGISTILFIKSFPDLKNDSNFVEIKLDSFNAETKFSLYDLGFLNIAITIINIKNKIIYFISLYILYI